LSLILDALKKLEREKGGAEAAVVVVGPVPWGSKPKRRRGPLVLGAALSLAVIGLAAWWSLRPGSGPGPSSASPSPAPVATSTSPPDGPPTAAGSPSPALAVPTATATRAVAAPAVSTPRPDAEMPSAVRAWPAPDPTPTPTRAPAAAPAAASARPPVGPAVPDLRLTAISERDGQPVALVNDRLVREGDSFDGVLIVRIGEAEVEVEVRGQRRVLRF
jgi:hypothetical protein